MKIDRKVLAAFTVSFIALGAAMSASAGTVQPVGLQGSVVAAERYRAAQEGAAAIKLQTMPVASPGVHLAADKMLGVSSVEAQRRFVEGVEAQRRFVEGVEAQRRFVEGVEAQRRFVEGVEAQRKFVEGVEAQRRFVEGVEAQRRFVEGVEAQRRFVEGVEAQRRIGGDL